MKLSRVLGLILLLLALTVSASHAAVQDNSRNVPAQDNGGVTILNSNPYMGLDDYILGVPSQREKPSVIPAYGREDTTYMGLESYKDGVPSQSAIVVHEEEPALFYAGTLSAIDTANDQITVRLPVPGTVKPNYWDVPFNVTKDTTMTICLKSYESCDSSANAIEQLNKLNELEKLSDFSTAPKDVIIVGNQETGEVVHVEIVYNM